ncbi:MAG: transcriptional regulator [Cyclobacteriaceae bacterium]
METHTFKEDIKVFCVTATSFPDGVKAAHENLHSILPYSTNRMYFGISYPDPSGQIIYRAAANALENDDMGQSELEQFVIPQGQYLSRMIPDFMKNIQAIGDTFKQLIADPRIDPKGFCLEWYKNDKDCQCLVKLAD